MSFAGSRMVSDILAANHENQQIITEFTPSTGITLVGYSAIGTHMSSTGWIIKRLYSVTTGTTTTNQVTYADGDYETYQHIWDDRNSYSYTIPA